MPFRPNITIHPKTTNDVLALLNEQPDLPQLPVGTVLKIQNKSEVDVFIHETDGEPTSNDGGLAIYYKGWRYETNASAAGIKATVKGTTVAVLGIEVVESE
tara:strand:- start:27113 stop:27415 length:303 start_codon:yes stop_codon:yes gene_type:complete